MSGISEKVLAAQRAGVKTIIFPESKKVDVEDLESDVTEGVELIHAGVISTISDRVLI